MKTKIKILLFFLLCFLFNLIANSEDFSGKFNKVKAYEHLVNQCNYGPRVPGSEAHQKCLEYIKENLEKCNFKVELQQFEKHSSLLDEYSKGNANNDVMQMYRSQMKNVLDFINELKQVKNNFVLADVIGRSEQFICPDCKKPEKEYRDGLCEMCHKWHTS